MVCVPVWTGLPHECNAEGYASVAAAKEYLGADLPQGTSVNVDHLAIVDVGCVVTLKFDTVCVCVNM